MLLYSVGRRGLSANASLRVLDDVTLPFDVYVTYLLSRDTCRWTVCLGRNAAENVSVAPKGWLNRVRNPVLSARAKASLTGIPM